jgi:hypothetical protein
MFIVAACFDQIYSLVFILNGDPGGHAVYGVGLTPLDFFDRGFKSR